MADTPQTDHQEQKTLASASNTPHTGTPLGPPTTNSRSAQKVSEAVRTYRPSKVRGLLLVYILTPYSLFTQPEIQTFEARELSHHIPRFRRQGRICCGSM
jgi:hypothetical protein